MKKTSTFLAVLLFLAFQTAFSANINITISGFAYSPNTVTVSVGDVVTIAASGTHPLVEVDQATWMANGNTPVGGGWGTQTSAYTFTVTGTTANPTYYVCANHVSSMQMKGVIGVAPSSGIMQTVAGAYKIELYPNPVTNGSFTVKAEGFSAQSGKVMLYNTEGKLLETHELTGVLTEVKTKLPAGAYLYSVMIGSNVVSRSKFIVAQSK